MRSAGELLLFRPTFFRILCGPVTCDPRRRSAFEQIIFLIPTVVNVCESFTTLSTLHVLLLVSLALDDTSAWPASTVLWFTFQFTTSLGTPATETNAPTLPPLLVRMDSSLSATYLLFGRPDTFVCNFFLNDPRCVTHIAERLRDVRSRLLLSPIQSCSCSFVQHADRSALSGSAVVSGHHSCRLNSPGPGLPETQEPPLATCWPGGSSTALPPSAGVPPDGAAATSQSPFSALSGPSYRGSPPLPASVLVSARSACPGREQ